VNASSDILSIQEKELGEQVRLNVHIDMRLVFELNDKCSLIVKNSLVHLVLLVMCVGADGPVVLGQ